MKAIITIGPSSSGKTTFAESLDGSWVNINRDDLRFTLTGCKSWKDYKFNKDIERMVTETQNSMMESAAMVGKNVIISDTNLNIAHRTRLRTKLEGIGYDVEYKEFDVDFDTLLKRNQFRDKSVPYEVLLDQYVRFQRYTGVMTYKGTPGKPKAIIFDIDGTLADKGDRSPFDYSRVGEDTPIGHAIDMAIGYWDAAYEVIFLSGREQVCYKTTKNWIEAFTCIPESHIKLFMRKEGDHRKDYIIKMELFNQHIRDNYDVKAVVDDRKQVIEQCWSVLGIPVINVGNIKERF